MKSYNNQTKKKFNSKYISGFIKEFIGNINILNVKIFIID